MESDVILNNSNVAWDLLLSRFPEIGFLLSLEPVQAEEVKGESEEEIKQWAASLPLEGIEVLYVFGVGLGIPYVCLKQWLQEKKGRTLVFFEESLASLQTLFSLPIGSEILSDPKVHIRFLAKPFRFDEVFEDCVKHWISDHVELVAIPSYHKGREKKVEKLRVQLLRKSALMSVAITECLHYHKLMENIGSNFLMLPNSFHVNQWENICKGIPAIICGAGVSLMDAVKQLKGLEQKAIIIAGGSAITALHHFGIRPHITMALDPNDEEYSRLKPSGSFELPLIYSSRLNKDVLTSMNVRPGYLCSDTGGSLESWMQQELNIDPKSLGPELGVEALSVTTLAVPFAKYLGCNPILFCGVDLSYKDMQRYPPGVVASAKVFLEEMEAEKRSMEKLIRKKNTEGNRVYTLVKWVMEAACLGSYVKTNKETKFFNASSAGLPIPHVSNLSLEEFVRLYCKDEYDLRGRLHTEEEQARFISFSTEDVKKGFEKLVTSLKNCTPILEEMLQEIDRKQKMPFDPNAPLESGKMQVLGMDLIEQPSYTVCLEAVFHVYQRILDRCFPCDPNVDPETLYKTELEKKKQHWTECQKVVKLCLDVLEKYI